MKIPLTDSEIENTVNAMLAHFGRVQTDETARQEITLWITFGNQCFSKGYAAGLKACRQIEPDKA